MWQFASLLMLSRFSLSLSFEILICLNVDVFEFILLPNLLSFLVIYIHVFHQIWQVFSNYFFKSSLCPFLFIFFFVTPKMCVLIHLTMFHGSHSLFSHLLFSSCPPDSVIFLIWSSSLLILSACSNLPWSHSSELFIVVILLFNPRFFFSCFISLYCYFYFIRTSFSGLSLCFPLVLWIFMTAILKYFSSIWDITFFSGTVADVYFSSLNGPYSPVSLHALWFLF